MLKIRVSQYVDLKIATFKTFFLYLDYPGECLPDGRVHGGVDLVQHVEGCGVALLKQSLKGTGRCEGERRPFLGMNP